MNTPKEKKFSFSIVAPKKGKYLEIILTKKLKYLNTEDYRCC